MLSFTQGFAFGIPCSAKENVMTIDFVVYLGTCSRRKPTSIYCASCHPPPPPVTTTKMAQSYVPVERKCKGPLWISVVSFRRDLFADEKLAKVSVLECVAVCAHVVCWPNCFFGEMNPTGSSSAPPLSCSTKKHRPLRRTWTGLCCTEVSKIHQICMSWLQC